MERLIDSPGELQTPAPFDVRTFSSLATRGRRVASFLSLVSAVFFGIEASGHGHAQGEYETLRSDYEFRIFYMNLLTQHIQS